MKAILARLRASVAGVPPETIALILSAGLVLGVFPVFGLPTLLCTMAAFALRPLRSCWSLRSPAPSCTWSPSVFCSRLIAFFATCAAAPALRRRFRTRARFMLPGGAAIPFAGMAVILWLLSSPTLREALAVIGATLAGLAAYWFSRRRRDIKPAAEPVTL